MIQQETVFILGAGASKPYGFPTGPELKTNILKLPVQSYLESAKLRKTNPGFSPVWNYLINEFAERDILAFFSDLKKSGFSSVDAFLEHRNEYIDIGKTLIAMELIKYEDENFLYSKPEESWYQYLYHNKLRASFDEFALNKISFLTFNYDRSLEQFLINSIMSDYGKTDTEAAAVLQQIPIIHLHGMLGNLPAISKENSRIYNRHITPKNLEICKNKIKIIHEGIEEDEQFQKARKLLSTSTKIWFLGFGFDTINLQRLNLPGLLQNGQALLATTYKLRRGEVYMNVHSGLGAKIDLRYIEDKSDLDNLKYIQEFSHELK